MSKKVLIITAFYNYDYDIRIKYLEDYLISQGWDYCILSSDFDHRKKVEYHVQRERLYQIHVPPYLKNLSYSRIQSHYVFSRKMYEYCSGYKPDIIYAITPPNYMFYYLKKYKKKQNVHVICEIEDLWPESLPINKTIKKVIGPVLSIWSFIRDKNINSMDYIVYECKLFENYLKNKVHVPGKTIYLCREDTLQKESNIVFNEKIEYIYLGSVNSLIDIDIIVDFLKKSAYRYETVLNVIGAGERLDELIKKCGDNNITIINHGCIFQTEKKEEIMKHCHFAFNIMKTSVYVGATMKSLEYFHYGIPVINNIYGDTATIIDEYKCGVNIMDKNTIEKFLDELNEYGIQAMSKRSREVYYKFFHPSKFEQNIDTVFKFLNSQN